MMRKLGCKVFSATRAHEREDLGVRVTRWIEEEGLKPEDIESKEVRQSSDSEYHCLTIVIWYYKGKNT